MINTIAVMLLSDMEDRDRGTGTEGQRGQRQRLDAKHPACQTNQLTDASQNSLRSR